MRRLFFIILFFSGTAFGQTDFGLWTGVKLRVLDQEKWKVEIENQYRFDNNWRHLENIFISPSIEYRAHKNIDVSYAYRLNANADGNSPLSYFSHRSAIDIQFRKLSELFMNVKRLDLSFRIRGTSEYSSKKGFDHYLRFAPSAEYNLKGTRIIPSISAEFFYHFRNQIVYTFTEVRTYSAFNKVRLKAGIAYPLNDKMSIQSNFIYQKWLAETKQNCLIELNWKYIL